MENNNNKKLNSTQEIFDFIKSKIQNPYTVKLNPNNQVQIIDEKSNQEIMKMYFNQNEIIMIYINEKITKNYELTIFAKTIIQIIKTKNENTIFDPNLYSEMDQTIRNNSKDKIFFSKTQETLGQCPETINYFLDLFNKNSKHYKKGALIYINGKLLGLMKLKGNRLLLSLKTKNNNLDLRQFHVYNTTDKISSFVNKKTLDLRDLNIFKKLQWKTINLKGDFPINLENNKHLFFRNSQRTGSDIKIITHNIESYIEKTYNENKDIKVFDIEKNINEI